MTCQTNFVLFAFCSIVTTHIRSHTGFTFTESLPVFT